MKIIHRLDITERLENSASTLHSSAYLAMMDAKSEILKIRQRAVIPVNELKIKEVAAQLGKMSSTVHGGAEKIMIEAKGILLGFLQSSHHRGSAESFINQGQK